MSLDAGGFGHLQFAALQAGKVKVYTGASGTVAEAVEQFKAGELKMAESASVEGHWV
jgi:predicted Fe-Mo cluster-binding NifX family protein